MGRLAMPFADVAFIAQASLFPHLRAPRSAPANGPATGRHYGVAVTIQVALGRFRLAAVA